MISTMCPPFPIHDVDMMSVQFRSYGRGGTSPTTVAMDAFCHGERRELMMLHVEGSDENLWANNDVCDEHRNSVCSCAAMEDRSRLTCNGQNLICKILHGF